MDYEVAPGQTFVASYDWGTPGLVGTLSIKVEQLPAGTLIQAASTTGFTEFEPSKYAKTLTAPTTKGAYAVIWSDGTNTETESLLVGYTLPSSAAGAFATHADVAARLGRTLTSAEQTTATDVISVVTAQIVDEVDRDSAWATTLSPVPSVLKGLCVQKAIKALSNPSGIASESLGAHSVTYPRSQDDSGIFLTPAEARLVRQAVYGALTGSSTPRALPDRLIDLAENRDVDEVVVE